MLGLQQKQVNRRSPGESAHEVGISAGPRLMVWRARRSEGSFSCWRSGMLAHSPPAAVRGIRHRRMMIQDGRFAAFRQGATPLPRAGPLPAVGAANETQTVAYKDGHLLNMPDGYYSAPLSSGCRTRHGPPGNVRAWHGRTGQQRQREHACGRIVRVHARRYAALCADAGRDHCAVARRRTVGITYVNPSDDPRKTR